MQIIDSQNKLDNFILNLRSESVIGLDTEFVRERTYWPDLCLIQIATKNDEFIVDIKSKLNFDSLWEIIQDPKIVKLIHSCKQDIEAIYYLSGKVVTPIFDTQMAAMFCGFTDSISYAQLVKEILEIDLDKDLQYSDWSERPLNKKKCEYAINDVKYLRTIYLHLQKKLSASEKKNWVYEEMKILSRLPSVISKNLKSKEELLKKDFSDKDIIDRLRELRENIAILSNIPRKRILTDSNINALLEQKPNDLEYLKNILIENRYVLEDDYLTKIIEVITKKPIKNNTLNKILNSKLSKKQKSIVGELNKILKNISEEYKICSHLIANQSDLKNLVRNNHKNIKFLKGWRYDLFGKLAFEISSKSDDKPD
jgi:ribonuclease D